MGLVYHASSNQGITVFYPRRFWHCADFSISGRLDDGEKPPPGALVTSAFYASDWDFLPFYFVPPDVPRIQLRTQTAHQFAAGMEILGPYECRADRVLFIDDKARSIVENYTFSVYEFEEKAFRRLANGEYIATQPVTPTKEMTFHNPLLELQRRGVQVEFLSLNADHHRRLKEKKVPFDAQACQW